MGDQRDNVKVAIRIRPLNEKERQECGKSGICIQEPNKTLSIDIKSEKKSFTFDYIASEEVTQQEVFERIGKPITSSCLSGYNGTIFAYGQTGAGKTFTILGNQIENIESFTLSSEYPYRGLLPRCFEYLFNAISEESLKSNTKFLIKCSYLEIYQEQVNDLLDPNPQNLQLREDMRHGVYVDGLIEETVTNVNETYNILKTGTQNRHVGCTSMNKESSRSHSVFTLVIESKESRDGITNFRISRFSLIDLAGSERQKATDCAGERLKEAGMINKSLSALGNVINSLVDISEGKSRHIHYRDSKLTFLLKDSLGGNSKTYIVANISPSITVIGETLSTLKFAQRAKQIKNSAVVNEDTSGAVSMLRYEVKRLKDELCLAKEQNICNKCNSMVCENDDKLLEILEETIRLKEEDKNTYNSQILNKENYIQGLKSALAKFENKISNDKMILKFRDATILSLQNSNFDENAEIKGLKKEVEILREQIESNPVAAKLFVENEKLSAEILELKAEKAENPDFSNQKVAELELLNCRLRENINPLIHQKEKICEKLAKTEHKKNSLKTKKKELESTVFKLQEKITDLELMNFTLKSENNVLNEESNLRDLSIDDILFSEQDLSAADKIDEILTSVNEQQIILQTEFLNKLKSEELIQELQEKIAKIEQENEELKEKVEKNSGSSQIHESEMKKIAEELSYLEDSYQKKEQEAEANKKELIQLFDQNSELVKSIQELQYLLRITSDRTTLLEKDLENSQKNSKENEEKNLNFEKSISNYQEELRFFSEKNECLADDNKAIRTQYDELLEKFEISEEEIKTFQEKNKKLKTMVEHFSKNETIMNEKINYYADEYLKVSQDLEDAKVEIEELITKLKVEKEKNDMIEDALENNKLEYARSKLETETKYIEVCQELKHLELEIGKERKLNSSNKDFDSKVKTLEDELKIAKNSADSFQELNLALTQKNAEQSNALAKIHSSYVPIYIVDQLRTQLIESQQEIFSLTAENQKKTEMLKSTKHQINLTKNDVSSWKKCIDDKNSLISELKAEIHNLRNYDKNAEIKNLSEALIIKDKELKELKEKGQEYYSQADEVLENMRKKCMSLQNEVNGLREELRNSSQNSQNLENKRQKAGLRDYNENLYKNSGKTNEEISLLKAMNHKITDELRKNVQIIESLQKKNLQMNKRLIEFSYSKSQYEEEIANLTDGLTKITDFVFNLPLIKFSPEENSIVDSTIRAISLLYENFKDKRNSKLCN